jgi:hypothetical protein
VVQQIVTLQAAPGSRDAVHRHTEAIDVQLLARETFSPGMRRLIDVDADADAENHNNLWSRRCRTSGRYFWRFSAPATRLLCSSPGPLWVGARINSLLLRTPSPAFFNH